VALIDYQKLQAYGVPIATAPDLARTFKAPRDYDNMSGKDYFAEFQIPVKLLSSQPWRDRHWGKVC
jgi:hypothetical protein